MQNITLARISTPPMLVGLCIAALLLFAVVGVVKEVSTINTAAPVQNSVTAGLQALQPPVQPAGEALPAFTLAPQTQPVLVVGVSDRQPETLSAVTVYVPATPLPLPTATPVRPPWLTIAYDVAGGRWVWIGEFYVSCAHIDLNYTYHNDRDVEARAAWNQLAFGKQAEVKEQCHE